jgi:hypothetical protein
MREKQVRERLIIKMKKMLKEIVNKIRLNEKVNKCSWTRTGLRRGNSLSPILFNLLEDVNEIFRKHGWGKIILEKEKADALFHIYGFKRKEGKIKVVDWRWQWKNLTEARTIKYAGHNIQKNRREEEHLKNKTRIGAVISLADKFGRWEKDIQKQLGKESMNI